MATRSELRTGVAGIIGLDLANAEESARVDRHLNEGIRQVLIDTRCNVDTQTVTPGAADDYVLTTAVLSILEMFFTQGSDEYELQRVSPHEILHHRRATSSGPTRFYALAGADRVMFYPQPGASDTVTMYYVARPTEMTLDAHDPSDNTFGGIPEEHHDLIEFYALWRLADYDDDQSSAQGTRYQQLYREGVARFWGKMRMKGGTRLNPAPIARRLVVPQSPSADLGW